ELDRLFLDVAKYSARIMGPTHVENVADLACRTAPAYRGVAPRSVPLATQEQPLSRKGSKRNVPHHTSDVAARSARLPDDDDLARAADVLNQGTKAAILAGPRALTATTALQGAGE